MTITCVLNHLSYNQLSHHIAVMLISPARPGSMFEFKLGRGFTIKIRERIFQAIYLDSVIGPDILDWIVRLKLEATGWHVTRFTAWPIMFFFWRWSTTLKRAYLFTSSLMTPRCQRLLLLSQTSVWCNMQLMRFVTGDTTLKSTSIQGKQKKCCWA